MPGNIFYQYNLSITIKNTIMSIIKDIGKFIKGWRLDKFFKGLVGGDKQSAKDLQTTVEQASTLVNNIKAYLASPVADIFTAVIPGDWDDKAKESAKVFIERITANSAKLTGCLEMGTVGEQLSCIYAKILNIGDEDETKSFWHKLGVLATKVFADGKLRFGDAVLAAQFVYEIITKPNIKQS